MLTQSNRHLRVSNNTHKKQTNKDKFRQNKRRQTEGQCIELHKRMKIKLRKKEKRHVIVMNTFMALVICFGAERNGAADTNY
jgi:hypothetical protein